MSLVISGAGVSEPIRESKCFNVPKLRLYRETGLCPSQSISWAFSYSPDIGH